jgi:GT2 family glycosyltransferase
MAERLTTDAYVSKRRLAPGPSTSSGNHGSGRRRASIIIVHYDSHQHLHACLEALNCGSEEEVEMIVVDNASAADGAHLIARDFPRTSVISSPANLGYGGGCNLGASKAQGRYLAFLNPDTIVQPGWLDALIDALKSDSRAGLATPKILMASSPDLINACGNDVHLTGLTLCRGLGAPSSSHDRPSQVSAVSGAAFLVRRELFERLGGFDSDYFMYFEDTDLSLRARLAGYRSLYVPTATVHHQYRLRFGPLKTYYQERNRYMTLLKTLRWPTLVLLLPILLLGEVVTWGFTLCRLGSHWPNKLHAYAYIWRNWRQIMAKRRQMTAARIVTDRRLLRHWVCRLAFEQTGNGWLPRAAHLLFDPLFHLGYLLTRALLWW